jgi:hypothetical protein
MLPTERSTTKRRKHLNESKVIAKARGIAERIYDKTLAKKVDKMTLEQQVAGIRRMMRFPGFTMANARASMLEDDGLPKDIKKYAGLGWTEQNIKVYYWGCKAFRELWADLEMVEATLDELIRSSLVEFAVGK